MATAVQIELQVDEKGAVSGIRSFDMAVKGSTGSVRQLGTELNAVGTHAAAAGQKGKQALDQVGMAAISSHEKVRLVSEEFGIRIPRAMQTVISKSPQVTAALNAVGGAMIALGAIQIGGMVFAAAITGAKKLWDNYLSLNSAAEEYEKTLRQQKDEDYWNSRDIETTTLRINQATTAAEAYRSVASSINKQGWSDIFNGNVGMGIGELYAAHQQAGEAVKNRQRVDKLTPEQDRQNHEDRLTQIELEHAGDAKLRGEQKITAEKRKQHQIDIENSNFKYGLDIDKGNPAAAAAGENDRRGKDKIADAKADADLFNLRREQGQELSHMREQAREAGLRGVSLYKAQEAAAIEELKFKDMDSVAARAAVHAKFHAEELRRLEDEGRETAKIERQAGLAGLTGIAKIQTEGANRSADIDADPNLDPANRARRKAAGELEANAEIAANQKAFAEQVDQIVEQSQARELTGFERIKDEAEKARKELQKRFDDNHNMMDLSAPGAQARLDHDTTLLGTGMNAIDQGESRQSSDLADRNAKETAQIEEQARVKYLSAEKQKTAAIQSELNERLQKYKEEKEKEGLSEEDYNRRVAAAQQNANAEMVEAATEARKKMAGEFTEFFEGMEHPGRYFAKLGDKAAGEAAASLFQRFQGGKGGAGDTHAGSGVFGDVLGGFGFGGFGKKGKTPGAGADAKAEMRGGHGDGQGTFSVTSAIIHVGSATISGVGTAGPGGNGALAVGPGGSTTLLASRATGASGGFGTGGFSASTAALSASGKGSITGGAGAGVAGAVTGGLAAPGGGVGPSKSAQARGALGDVSQGYSLTKQLASDFSGGGGKDGSGKFWSGSSDDKDGTGVFGKSSDNGSMTSDGFSATNVTGAAQGAMGVWGAHESAGGVGGGLKGAASGAEMGMMIAGPMGALVGAAAGAIVGAIGSSGAAQNFDEKTVKPRIASDLAAYHSGSMSYLDAYSDAQSLQMEAAKTTTKMGPADGRYYQNTIKPELKQFMGKLTAEQKAGRSQYTASAASYDTGDTVDNFGGLALSPTQGLAQVQLGEFMVKPHVAAQNMSTLRALNAGASMDTIHSNYQKAMQSSDARRGSGGGDRTMNMNVHAIDSKGVSQFLDKYKHQIRSAVNDSYAENSGGGMN